MDPAVGVEWVASEGRLVGVVEVVSVNSQRGVAANFSTQERRIVEQHC